jgi:hypothetical protein
MARLQRTTEIKELRREFDSIRSTCAGDTRFVAQALMFIAERLDAVTRGKATRKPSEWQRFFGRGIKAGKTPAQIGEEWRARGGAS